MGLSLLNSLKLCNQSLKVITEHLCFFGQWVSSHKSHEEKRASPPLRLQLVFGQKFLWMTKLLKKLYFRNVIMPHIPKQAAHKVCTGFLWMILFPQIIFNYYNHPSLTFSADKKASDQLQLHDTLPWTVAHPSGGHGRIQRSSRGGAGAQLLAQATIQRRDGEATEQ